MKEMYWVGNKEAPAPPSRKERKRRKTSDLNSMWREFLIWANDGVGCPSIGLYSNIRGLLAYSLEREGYPSGDIFDRMRVRVTGAMPPKFRAKIIEEMKSGIRHMRSF